MNTSNLTINQLIEVEVEVDANNELSLPSRIEEIVGDYLHISAPMYRGSIMPLRVGQTLKIFLTYNDVTYAFYTTIIGRKWNRIPMLIVKKPDTFIKIQRRGFLRLPVAVNVRFRLAGENTDISTGVTVDISGGGALILTQDIVDAGQTLEMEIDLPNREPIYCRARVIRVLEKANSKGKATKAALEFKEINEGQRDKIVNFIFEKQREWIQKGLLR